ncbi:MAG: alpha/beta fold hydrolase [Verrucomicrobia bacterium]|nr:alpha/beta fold hydrolase [Verrucomicrobiota bacterium]
MFHPFDIIFWYGRFCLWRAGLRRLTTVVRGQTVGYWDGGAGQPILLIHGLGGSTLQDFGNMTAHLAKRHRVIALDLPGFGLSQDVKIRQSVSEQAAFLVEFLDAIGVSRTILFGNSMGGWIALKLAHRHCDRVARLILAAPAGIRFTPPPLDVFMPEDEAGTRRLLGYLFHKPPPLPGWFARDWLRVSRQRRHSVIEMLDSMVTGQDLMDDVAHEIRTPTLILWGAHDRLIPSETGHRFAALLPNARLKVFDRCGHLLLHEDFSSVARCLDAWLENDGKWVDTITRAGASSQAQPSKPPSITLNE